MDFNSLALALHKTHGGKITTALRDIPDTQEKLSAYYTPGVAAVSAAIAAHPELLREYTWTHNLVAIVSDGSAVLGMGNIGPKASMPVMEGKAMLFKHFANIDAVPIILDVHTADEIVATVKAIAPSFGAINLEDIAAPLCFEVEQRLKTMLDIPVMHDDQHGTAVVVLAGLINAATVAGKQLASCKVVLLGAGAAGVAIARLLHLHGISSLVAVDSKGIISSARTDLTTEKQQLAALSNAASGNLQDALKNADIVIGVSRAHMLTAADIQLMAPRAIVFALANPTPEIMPDVAQKAGAAVVATGRSDFANQVNNALAFPGIFRGALDHNVRRITDTHKHKAAKAIAALVPHPTAEMIIPSVFDPALVPAIAAVITELF